MRRSIAQPFLGAVMGVLGSNRRVTKQISIC